MKKPDPARFDNVTHFSPASPRWRKIGTITSVPVSQGNRFGDLGQYEIEMEIDMNKWEADPDREGLMKTTIATHLAGCAANTGLPVGEKVWQVQLDPWVTFIYPQLPKEFFA